jgi:hypothetical protein
MLSVTTSTLYTSEICALVESNCTEEHYCDPENQRNLSEFKAAQEVSEMELASAEEKCEGKRQGKSNAIWNSQRCTIM